MTRQTNYALDAKATLPLLRLCPHPQRLTYHRRCHCATPACSSCTTRPPLAALPPTNGDSWLRLWEDVWVACLPVCLCSDAIRWVCYACNTTMIPLWPCHNGVLPLPLQMNKPIKFTNYIHVYCLCMNRGPLFAQALRCSARRRVSHPTYPAHRRQRWVRLYAVLALPPAVHYTAPRLLPTPAIQFVDLDADY